MAWNALPLVLLSAAALTGCGHHATAPKPSPAATKPFDLTPEETAGCLGYGKIAGTLAADRDDGIPLSQQLASIRERLGTGPDAQEFADMATAIYEDPASHKQPSDSEEDSWAMDCALRVAKKRAGAKYFHSPAEIREALADFKTYDGTPLTELFGSYGITISYVEAVPAEVYEPVPHDKGELVYQLTFSHGATRVMPCRLQSWFNGKAMPTPTIIRRGAEFPHIRPKEDDAAIYWAATGKCSQAY